MISGEFEHLSVMLPEVLENLAPGKGKIYIDATAGLGGHLKEIARLAGPDAYIIGIDQDQSALELCRKNLLEAGFDFKSPHIELVQGNFEDIQSICARLGIDSVDGGILADIGVSSMQLDDAERGFSFMSDGPLDMRMDRSRGITAAELLNTYSEKEIADILYKYGEEKKSRQIARRIVESRPISRTSELTALVCSVLGNPHSYRRGADKSHPATRSFQALRIAVNDELRALENFLSGSIRILAAGGRLVVISFHSLEDRVVKQIFKSLESNCICPPKHPICNCSKRSELKILTKKPLQPGEKETLANPRSRSAKLRAGERVIGEV
ncbi:MAG: 16S rRNA (cytosine(1402)-N(4))-methyltransferase RsmH [Candidatus Obscuribacterales bacterium]|nr:16S rRNA (cytosine(1402)-N(4))-methyltransferase RsmH [Candidatus Obscuribacterales bacterium]